MGIVYIESSGCITNLADDNIIKEFFLKNGWQVSDKPEESDLIVFNTCGYNTSTFDRIRDLQHAKKDHAELVVGGCMPAMRKRQLRAVFQGTTFGPRSLDVLDTYALAGISIARIAGNVVLTDPPRPVTGKGVIVDLIGKQVRRFDDSFGTKLTDLYRHLTLVRLHDRRIFFIKIAVGCMGNCTFCSRRRAKGRTISKDIGQIVREFKDGLARGYQEFLLSADDSGSWGQDCGKDITQLLEVLVGYDKDYRIHIRYIEPNYFIRYFDKLMDIFASNKIFFIGSPIQSGSTRLLKLMNRRYSAEDYVECIREVNARYPKIFFQTHFLVGYPLETEEDFQASISVMDKIRVDDVQIYQYHPEPGTVGGNITPQLPFYVRRQRAEILRKHYMKRKIINNLQYLTHLFLH